MDGLVYALIFLGIGLAIVALIFGLHFNNNKNNLAYELSGEGDTDLSLAIAAGSASILCFGGALYAYKYKK